MATGYMAGCNNNSSNTESQASESSLTESTADSSEKDESKAEEASKSDADTQAEEEAVELPAAVFSVDVPCVETPDKGAEVTQVLKLSSSTSIDGSVKADEIKLGGSFENMKVSDVSNDAGTITLTVSGVPTLEGAPTIGFVGTMEIAGSHFGSEKPVEASVPVMCKSGDAAKESYFYPFFDSVVDNDTSKELHIFLRPYGGTFNDLTKDKITLDGVLKGAEIASVKKAENDEYELVVNVKSELDGRKENTYGTITLAKGSMTNNEKEVSYTRDFSAETIGRKYRNKTQKFSKEQLDQLKEVMHPKKSPGFIDSTFPEIGTLFNIGKSVYGYYGTAMTAYKTIYSMLGAFGIVEIEPSDEEKRHQEIMEALGNISEQISTMQEDVDAIRSYTVDNKRALEDLSLITTQDYIAQFHSHYDAMVKYTNEIENALMENSDEIIALAEAHYVEGEEGEEMNDNDIERIIMDFGKEICELRQSNYYTIGEKMQILEQEYTTAMTYMKNDESNPISRYCQMYQYIDNFSTTSLSEKQAYELDIDCQFDRTLSYLMLLGGANSQKENVKMFDDSYFPDVVEEATNEKGNPYCYLMKKYVHIESDPTNRLMLPMKNGDEKYNVLLEEDIDEFFERMQGRNMTEELELAGFDKEKFTNMQTKFSKSDFSSRCSNNSIFGLAFEFRRIQADTKGVPAYGNVGDAKKWKDLARYVATHYEAGNSFTYYQWSLCDFFRSVKDPSKSFIIVGRGANFDGMGSGRYGKSWFPCSGYLNKDSNNSMCKAPKGWYNFEMMTYLVQD